MHNYKYFRNIYCIFQKIIYEYMYVYIYFHIYLYIYLHMHIYIFINNMGEKSATCAKYVRHRTITFMKWFYTRRSSGWTFFFNCLFVFPVASCRQHSGSEQRRTPPNGQQGCGRCEQDDYQDEWVGFCEWIEGGREERIIQYMFFILTGCWDIKSSD